MPNTPYLDKSVRWRLDTGNLAFHELRYREVEEAILDGGLATEVVAPIGSGKEANVYLCRDRERLLVVKAYRYYRTSHKGVGSVRAEGLGQVASREYELLGYAWAGRAPVPEPLEREEYMLSMQYLGTEETPAPRLKDVRLEDPEPFAKELLDAVERLTRAGIVHTDLSPFNILVHEERPWIIDFADALRVDRLGGAPFERLTRARTALEKGLGALERYFARYGVPIPAREFVSRTVDGLDRYGLLG